MKNSILLLLLTVLFGCDTPSNAQKVDSTTYAINANGKTLSTRFNPPKGYQRTKSSLFSFGTYLRNLPLKKSGSLVKYFDGGTKPNTNVYAAVVELPIGKRDLHQCADAVMRLRAEYLWKQKKYDEIHFNFTNGFVADYNSWRSGKRIVVKGNEVKWVQSATASNDYQVFWKYLEMVFAYAGSLSLSKELKKVDVKEMQIGDAFVRGGSPGHCAIVVDMAIDSSSGKKVFMLAQSYMPAQETQVLWNTNNGKKTVWYPLDFGGLLVTPEYSFYPKELMRF